MKLANVKTAFKTRAKRRLQRFIPSRDRPKLRHVKRRVDVFIARRRGLCSLRVLSIDVTYKCTLSCVTCRVSTIEKSAYKDRPALKLADLAILLRDFKNLGGTVLHLSGGEPFLHPEFGSILAMAKEMGLQILVSSNHTLMNEKNAQYVSDYVDRFTLSLDGPCPEVNDVIRGKGAFRRAIEGRKTLRRVLAEKKKEWVAETITCTITKHNYKSMPQMVELAPTIGIKRVGFNYLSIVPDAVDEETERIAGIKRLPEESHWRSDQSLLIPSDQVEQSCRYADESKARGKELGVLVSCDCAFDGKHNRSIVTGEFRLPKKTTCNAFWENIGVLPDGSFFLCQMMQHYPVGSIRECKLDDILKHSGRVRLQKTMAQRGWLPICRYCCGHVMYSV